jgi:hypothetical protein
VAAGELYRAGDTVVRWDNTLKYSAALRVEGPAPALISDPNSDDGDRRFHAGLISNRFDLLSELSAAAGAWGFSASAAAWYDTIYNAAPGADTALPPSRYPLPPAYAPAVRTLHGRKIELLNGFVYGRADLAGIPVSFRAGRHTVLWGESLFFANNGIAAAQAPIDAVKALSVPVTLAKEVYMPVAQASLSIQATPEMTFNAYYQFEWRRNRFPGTGSYFSAADFVDAGGERIYTARDQYLTRAADQRPPGAGQFGLALRLTGGNVDYGVYMARFHAKAPQLYLRPLYAPNAGRKFETAAAYGTTPGAVYGSSNPLLILYPNGFGPFPGDVGDYNLAFPRGIEVFGVSASGYLGDATVAGEISLRRRMPLASIAGVVFPGGGDAGGNALYARGDTVHGQASLVMSLAPNDRWDAANFSGEIAVNGRLRTARNAPALDPSRDRFSATARVLFEPTFFAIAPGLDISVPVSAGVGVAGRSSTDAGQNPGAGSVEIGLSATYRAVWKGGIALTHYIGGPSRQPFADRDFISFSLQRTF